MISLILGWLSGPLAKALTRAYEAKLAAQNEEQRLVAEGVIADLQRQIEDSRNAKEIRLATAGFWEMRVATAVIAWTFAAHIGLVGFDTIVTSIDLRIPPFPSPMDQWESAIVLSFFGLQAFNKGVSAIASAIRGRK